MSVPVDHTQNNIGGTRPNFPAWSRDNPASAATNAAFKNATKDLASVNSQLTTLGYSARSIATMSYNDKIYALRLQQAAIV